MPQITIFLGGYGSGKSELSIAAALAAAQHEPTSLIDLDIINPAFRSTEQRRTLEAGGVALYSPTFSGTTLDLPALPARIQGVLQSPGRVLVDVGGDPDGAGALGRYHDCLAAGYQALFVINARRPLQQNLADLLHLYHGITARARVVPTGLINNTNLALQTTPQDVLDGQTIAEALSRNTGVPIVGIHGLPHVLDALPREFIRQHQAILQPLTPRMRPDWLA